MLTLQQAQRILTTEVKFQTSRSGGKGGQNVNKVETKVELEFDVNASHVLTGVQKEIILQKHRLMVDGCLIKTTSSQHRSQLQNKEEAGHKLVALLNKLLKPVKKRKATKPGKASKEKKLKDKKLRGEKKLLRQKIR